VALGTLSEDEMKWLLGEFNKYPATEGPEATNRYGDLIEEMSRLV
jgi:hypothetical protein